MKLVKAPLDLQAYHWLRDEIFAGTLPPGHHLVQDELAERLGVSRLPIRDAVRQLASDGLAEASSQGYVVRGLSVDDIVDAYDLRLCVEGMAARKCAAACSDAEIEALADILGEMDHNLAHGAFEANVPLDYRFHSAIYDASGSRMLARLSAQLWSGVPPNAAPWVIGKAIGDKWLEGLKRSAGEHRAIFTAIAARDGAGAEAAAAVHVANARDAILRNRAEPTL